MRTIGELDKIIGRRLRLAREAAQLRQQDLADAIGSSFQQIQKYERAQNRMSASTLLTLAEALAVPIAYFFDDLALEFRVESATAVSDKKLAEFAGSREGSDLLRKFHRLKSDAVREQVLKLLCTLGEAQPD